MLLGPENRVYFKFIIKTWKINIYTCILNWTNTVKMLFWNFLMFRHKKKVLKKYYKNASKTCNARNIYILFPNTFEGGANRYTMDSHVYCWIKVRMTQHTHKPGNAYKTQPSPFTEITHGSALSPWKSPPIAKDLLCLYVKGYHVIVAIEHWGFFSLPHLPLAGPML